MLNRTKIAAQTSLVLALTSFALVPAARAAVTAPDLSALGDTVRMTELSECREDAKHTNSDAIFRICTPPEWWVNNGELIIWAHGYVDEFAPLEIPNDQVCFTDNLCVNDVANALGYGFATTSYAVNGLAVIPGMDDILELVDLYTEEVGDAPTRVYLIGASEGGLITALLLEQRPDVFDGGLALCGPIGDFVEQTNYFGDFRAVFDYYFPGLVPGDPTSIPQDLIDDWDNFYATEVVPVLSDPANQGVMNEVIMGSGAQAHPNQPRLTGKLTTDDLLWYSVFATNNGADVLLGQPYDNIDRVYEGTRNDTDLNAGVQRVAADPIAVTEMEKYQTTGLLTNPLVTFHTEIDQQVPAWHEDLYLAKTQATGSWPDLHVNLENEQVYGHCLFALESILNATCEMIFAVSGQECDFDLLQRLMDEAGGGEQLVEAHKLRR